jgi:hypothetical protein
MEIQIPDFTICSLKETNKSVTMTDYLRNTLLCFVELMCFLMIAKGQAVGFSFGVLRCFYRIHKPFSQQATRSGTTVSP